MLPSLSRAARFDPPQEGSLPERSHRLLSGSLAHRRALMPQAVPVPIRQAILRRRQEGHSLRAVAAEFHLSLTTVRGLLRRVRDLGPAGLVPGYARCGRPGPRRDADLIQAACELKRGHPTWGAVFIGIQLHDRFPDRRVPPART